VAAAEVKATQTQTGAVHIATSGPDGNYVFPNLLIGPYEIQVVKTGFKTFFQRGIELLVATNPPLNIALTIGAVNETVTVEADVPLVETQTTSIGAILKTHAFRTCPEWP
jgi:hypothetical protein